METKKLSIILVICITVFIVVFLTIYFINNEISEYEENLNLKFNDSYQNGTREGINYWNSIVINSVNNEKKIPYIENESIFGLPIKSLCTEDDI